MEQLVELEKSLFGHKWRGKRDKFSDPDVLKKVLKLYEKAKCSTRLLNPKAQDKIVSSGHRPFPPPSPCAAPSFHMTNR